MFGAFHFKHTINHAERIILVNDLNARLGSASGARISNGLNTVSLFIQSDEKEIVEGLLESYTARGQVYGLVWPQDPQEGMG